METKQIKGKISILANYENEVRILLYDEASNLTFCEIKLTHEQFVNAALNRLGNCEVQSIEIMGLEHVGKNKVRRQLVVEIPPSEHGIYSEYDRAKHAILKECPAGWIPDLYLKASHSFFNQDGKRYVRTTIHRYEDGGI